MSNVEKRLSEFKKHRHCRNCGKINPEIIRYGDTTQDGFTDCCNEDVCDGTKFYFFGDEQHTVEACCWAAAEIKFVAQGIDVSQMPFITRFHERGEI